MAEKRKLLIVTAYFAPHRAVGAKRFTYLCEIFEARGYEVSVLTMKEQCTEDRTLPIAGTVYRRAPLFRYPLPKGTKFAKLYNRMLGNWLCFPDPHIGWLWNAVREGLRIIKDRKCDLIVATAPPYSSLIAGALLSRMSGKRLVLDYRDPWTARDWTGVRAGRWVSGINAWMERMVVRRAGAAVFVTERMRKDFQGRWGATTTAWLHLIANGYHDRMHLDAIRPDNDGRLSIVYAGSLYGERRVGLIAEPLAALVADGRLAPNAVAIHVFGDGLKAHDERRMDDLGLSGVLVKHDPVNHATILRYLRGADLLYLPSGRDVRYALPFKLFDYLSVRVPILAVAPKDSAVADFMREVDCGEIADIDDPQSVRDALSNLLLVRKQYTFRGAERYTWDAIALCYMGVLDKDLVCPARTGDVFIPDKV
ncbi:MAG: glycosyltransferase family 4 protein [Pseudomonadota bacterium]|nr:glycosyltransferase family 4 protein [Gammaproteobacteria bacterium]MDQ3580485.1 glycosyltransferase family 4 protein [Pseudomonadota bacterium]